MVKPTPDIPLLRKCVEWAEAEAAKPYALREWMQSHYVVLSESDDSWEGSWMAHLRRAKSPECGTCFCIAGYADHVAGRDSEYQDVHESAQELLGLTEDEGERLFDGGNDIKDVRREAEMIAARINEKL